MKSTQFAYGFLQFLLVLVILLYGVLLFVFIYSLMDPSKFESVRLTGAFSPGFSFGNVDVCTNCQIGDYSLLVNLSTGMKLWLIFRASVLFLSLFVIITIFKRIIKSVSSKLTFYEGNIKNFRTLTYLGLMLTAFSSFNFFVQGEISDVNFSIAFGPIAFTAACWLLSDIFEEGRKLHEDKNSII